MKNVLITAAIASLVGGASLASAEPAHHTAPGAKPMADMPMHGHDGHKMQGKHRKMHCQHGAEGMRGMSGMSGTHDMMGNMPPSAPPTSIPTAMPTPAPVTPK